MSEVPRVGYLGISTFWGGATTSLALLLRGVDPARFSKHVLLSECQPGAMRDQIAADSATLEVLPIRPFHHHAGVSMSPRELAAGLEAARAGHAALIRAVRSLRLQVLHVNVLGYAHALRALDEACPALRIVVHAREVLPNLPRDEVSAFMREQVMRHADAVIAISDNEAPAFRDHPDLQVIPNPMDLSIVEGAPRDFRARHLLPLDRPLVGMLAAFLPYKGQLDFVAALERVLATDPGLRDFTFVLVGHPRTRWWIELAKRVLKPRAYTLQLQRFVAEHGLADNLLIIPYTYETAGILAALDVVVRCSRAGDPWGRDVIEAMAFGKPVVATGTSQFYVQDGVTGFLVPPGEPALMAEKVTLLLRDRALRESMGRRGAERVRAMCDHRRHGERVMAVYDRLLRG